MCAVCFTGAQLIPLAGLALRARLVSVRRRLGPADEADGNVAEPARELAEATSPGP